MVLISKGSKRELHDSTTSKDHSEPGKEDEKKHRQHSAGRRLLWIPKRRVPSKSGVMDYRHDRSATSMTALKGYYESCAAITSYL